ncbi:MAG: S8 family peptidase [Edaphocola sp.]
MIDRLKYILCLSILLGGTVCQAQDQYAYRVNITDKNATMFSLGNPQAYLGSRALERRNKFNIAIDSTDLPLVADYVDKILATTGGIVHCKSKWLNSVVILVTDTTKVPFLDSLGFVGSYKKIAEYSGWLHGANTQGSTPVNYSNLYNNIPAAGYVQSLYGNAWNQIHLCQGEYLHQQGYTGKGTLIAVIDVGFANLGNIAVFDSLVAQGRIADTWNFITDTSDVTSSGNHGIYVLSSVAGVQPDSYMGTAPDALYALYATDHESTEQIIEEDNLVAALERADSIGTDVVSSSLGYNTFDNSADSHIFSELDGKTTVAARGANMAATKGMVLVIAAGNEGQNSWQKILTPGDADSALTIGAVDADGQSAGFSGMGPNAAGLQKPDVCAMGVSASVWNPSGQQTTTSGTSISAPIIAGLTACVMQAFPTMPPFDIKTLLRTYADSFATPSYKRGYGVPNFKEALQNSLSVAGGNQAELGVTIFPNPANSLLHIAGKNNLPNLHYMLFSMQGRTVATGKLAGNHEIDLAHIANGLYLLVLQSDRGRAYFKVAINH